MILTITNQTNSTRNYLPLPMGGYAVTVSASASTVVPRELNVLLSQDANFLNDAVLEYIKVNNGAADIGGPGIITLAQSLAIFSTDRLATMVLYFDVQVSIRQTATTAAGAVVWAIRNNFAAANIVIEQYDLSVGFDGATPLGSSTLKYELARFSGATPSGGTTITPIRHSKLMPDLSASIDARFADQGLTMSGTTVESGFMGLGCPAVKGVVVPNKSDDMNIKLGPGDGLAILLKDNAAIVGQTLIGKITGSIR